MEHIRIDAAGELYCPKCGARQFSNRRTRGAKLAMGVTAGVGALAAPKRMQCLGCREYLKGPPMKDPAVLAAEAAAPRPPIAGSDVLDSGDVPVIITGCEWDGPAMVSMLNAARPGLPPAERKSIQERLRRGEEVELARLSPSAAARMVERLKSNGFTTLPLQVEAASPSGGPDLVSQLTGLAELRDRGILTDEEFDSQKARLLRGGDR